MTASAAASVPHVPGATGLKQVGTPMELYDKPANVFVASFIGTPPMNFVAATITDGGATLATAKFNLAVPSSLRGVTALNSGRNVVVGIRPENILEAGTETRGETAALQAEVEIAEPLGNEVVVHARVGDALLVAKLDPHHVPKLGDKVDLLVELNSLHLFDAETERRLE